MAAAQKSFLESISPWPSRSNTPRPDPHKSDTSNPPAPLEKSQGHDRIILPRHRLRRNDYPPDCPKSSIRWFYAVDVSTRRPTPKTTLLIVMKAPNRRPAPLDKTPKDDKPLPRPKKYAGFSTRDSRSIEAAFQELVEKAGAEQADQYEGDVGQATVTTPGTGAGNVGVDKNARVKEPAEGENTSTIKVPVNEDFLFDVDVERRELQPAYWLGPIYDVRRGSWFYQEGSSLRPCDENLADQLEEGYLKVQPWRYNEDSLRPADHKSKPRPVSVTPTAREDLAVPDAKPISSRSISSEDVQKEKDKPPASPINDTAKFQLQTQRLFGNYMNSVVTYQDATVAWLLTNDFMSRMSSTVYQRFAGGGHLGGVKVVRGYTEVSKSKDRKPEVNTEQGKTGASGDSSITKATDSEIKKEKSPETEGADIVGPDTEPRLLKLERQMSSLMSPDAADSVNEEEAIRKRDEDQIQEDYKDSDGDDQGREIEHLILVTHGIGQRLGMRLQTFNFLHDVNVLRKTLKSVYNDSPDLQALNDEVDKLPKNCRIQVLPVVWRHLLDFPKQSFKQTTKEQDLTEVDAFGEEEKYPSLDDITVDGVPAIRNLISDLALDILLYQSAYREHISGIVQRECNRIFELFMQRNPNFKGKISLIGHSLGSAILFDILCRQKAPVNLQPSLSRNKRHSRRGGSTVEQEHTSQLALNFDVESFFCLGSPLGLYQMLKGRRIAGRTASTSVNLSPMDPDALDDPFLSASAKTSAGATSEDLLSITFSSPKCQSLFNIFHPADPIAYRIEPLISSAMSSLKPQPLPYTKKGIFGAPGAGISGIGARVGQSVSGLWSNFTSGMASSLLNRSLGLTGDGQVASTQSMPSPQVLRAPSSSGAPSNLPASSTQPAPSSDGESKTADNNNEHPPTLIDGELETLYSGFQKRRRSQQSDGGRDLGESAEWAEADERAKRLKREEAKVRALNPNGRVDFSIQEGVFDISLIASIASHLSYWADEDVSHFMLGQLLSRQRVLKR